LAGEADAGDVFASEIRGGKHFAHGGAGGVPPILGVLLGPANLRGGKGLMIFGGGGDKATRLIDEEGSRAAGANVNSKNVNGAPRGVLERPARIIISIQAALARGVRDGLLKGSRRKMWFDGNSGS